LAVKTDEGEYRGFTDVDPRFPGHLGRLLGMGQDALVSAAAQLRSGDVVDLSVVTILPPLRMPEKIICVGLNYADHSAESGFAKPDYPVIFARFSSSLVGHGSAIVRPRVSVQLDFEGELAAVVGKGGRCITKAAALDHICGYSVFNDASIRDFQSRTPQWTLGKNFDGTGAFGPEFVTADELPRGCVGLRLQTRLNGVVMQSASTADMIFDVATLVAEISEAITLSPGDVIVTGTPSGVGLARTPPVWMKAGDLCEVEIEGVGLLSNPITEDLIHYNDAPGFAAVTV
jgi:2-keto-4-pentenoate hydratase/2-oxohepta-3-ene-1,7-dioic acid hydratase in catechol pathway